MADRTALTAGIAAASIAAVVAATPALITPPNTDVQVTASAMAAKQVSTDVQLVAFTLQGLLSAFADGYHDQTYWQADIEAEYDDTIDAAVADAIADAEAEAEANGQLPLSAAAKAQITVDTEASHREAVEGAYADAFTLDGEAGAIYYALDNLLPGGFDYDDHLFAAGGGGDFSTVFFELAEDLNVPVELVALILDPINTSLTLAEAFLGVPPIVQDFLNNPITTVVNTVAGPLGPLANSFINNPVGTVLAQAGDIGLLANAFLNDPVGTTALILGDDVYNFVVDPIGTSFDALERLGLSPDVGDFIADPVQTLARILARFAPAAQSVSPLTVNNRSVQTLGVSAVENETPKLFTLDVPAPGAEKKAEVTAVDGETEVAQTPTLPAPKFELPNLPTPEKVVADFNDGLARTAQQIANTLNPSTNKDKKADDKKADDKKADDKKADDKKADDKKADDKKADDKKADDKKADDKKADDKKADDKKADSSASPTT